MGKTTDQILGHIIRMRELSADAISELTARIRKAMIDEKSDLHLSWGDVSNLTLYLDSLKDTTEALEEEIEKVGGADGDERRSELALERENQELIDELEWTRNDLTSARVSVEALAELTVQLFKLCEKSEKISVSTRQHLERWKDTFYPYVRASKEVPDQWELIAGTYVLETHDTEEEANAALKLMLSGMTIG